MLQYHAMIAHVFPFLGPIILCLNKILSTQVSGCVLALSTLEGNIDLVLDMWDACAMECKNKQ